MVTDFCITQCKIFRTFMHKIIIIAYNGIRNRANDTVVRSDLNDAEFTAVGMKISKESYNSVIQLPPTVVPLACSQRLF